MTDPLLTATEPLPSFRVWSDRIHVSSAERVEFIDITDDVVRAVHRSEILDGQVNVQTLHTTSGILLNENEPLLLEDLSDMLEWWAPAAAPYRHDRFDIRTVNLVPGERRNGDSHARAMMLGSSECLNIVEGEIQLGRWQRIFFVELDGVRQREISISAMGTARARSRSRRAAESPRALVEAVN